MQVLKDADPTDKAEIYRRIRLTLPLPERSGICTRSPKNRP